MERTIGREQPPAGEEQVIAELVMLQLAIMQKTAPTRRGQHGKSHAFCDATFLVRDDIPEKYRIGLFAVPKAYEAVVRWSNGGSADDTTADVHGMAIKVRGVEGLSALDGTPSTEQDFILIDSEVFFAPDAKTLLDFMKARVASAARPEIMKEFAQNHPSVVGLLAASLRKIPSPLDVQYWSTVPYRFGEGAAVKYTAVPSAHNSNGRTPGSSGDYLRQATVERLAAGNAPAVFEMCIIPQTGSDPIEDPTVRWGAEPIPVATITVPAQTFDTPGRREQDEATSFDPWHALADHRPLGGINRGRKAVYAASVALRHTPAAII